MPVEFSEKFAFLFEPHRYKIAYGGRGGIKSWSFARALILRGMRQHQRWLCARELMKSLAESVHHLLETQIKLMGLESEWRIEKGGIFGPHGSEFAFSGLRDAQNLKSFEDFDGVWVEEANNVSKRSWDMLIPTIRKPGSEIWISFNPELDTDETYKRFVLNPPPSAVVVKTSWRDNNWLTDELRAEMDHSRRSDPDGYLTIWEGHCRQYLDGAIYANEIRELTQAGRITRVPYAPGKPVEVFCDLGIADHTALWFVQPVGFEWRFIDYYQNNNQLWGHYLKEMQRRPYVYGHIWLPHDGRRRDLGTGKSIENHSTEAGYRVKIVPQIGIKNGMDATRSLFTRSWFDEEKCADGLNCLRRYCWKKNDNSGIYAREPLHDENSNGADAYRMAAVGLTEPETKKVQAQQRIRTQISAWS